MSGFLREKQILPCISFLVCSAASLCFQILTHPCKKKVSYILRAEKNCLKHRVAPCSVVGSVDREREVGSGTGWD